MKKIVLLMSLMLMAFISGYALTADEIIGKWESSPIKQQASDEVPMDMSIKLLYNFAADMSVTTNCEMTLVLQLDKGVYTDFFMDIKIKGNYTVDGDSIVVNYIKDTADVTFTEDDIRIRGIEDADMVSQIKEALFAEFSQQKDEITAGFGDEPDVINDVTIAGNKMITKMDDEVVTFKRKKK